MEARVLAWARRVKARGGRRAPPPLWLFTDAARLPDPLAVAARLPRHLCGVVFRDDGVTGREALGRALARICRARGLALSVAGDWRMAARLGAAVHLRGGRRPATLPPWLVRATASAHRAADVRRSVRAGVRLVFVSPLFATASHPGARPLGSIGWRRLAAMAPGRAAALGGVAGASARGLPRFCRAVGGIELFRGE